MPNETKLLCNSCYNELDVNEYDDATYVERCTCEDETIMENAQEYAYNEGYDRGREESNEQVWEEAFYEGRQEGENDANERVYELENEVQELESKLEEYDEMACDLEYSDRIGA